METFKYNYN